MINFRIRTIGALAIAAAACECAADVPINGRIVTGNCTFFTAGINASASIQRIAAGIKYLRRASLFESWKMTRNAGIQASTATLHLWSDSNSVLSDDGQRRNAA